MDVVEPDEANETMDDLTDEQLEDVAGGHYAGENTGAAASSNLCHCGSA